MLKDHVDTVKNLIQTQQAYSWGYAHPEIVIEEGEYSITSSTPVLGGTEIMVGRDTCTAGICGYYMGNKALVTCGHGSIEVGDTVKFTSNYSAIGTVDYVQYSNGESGDFSIITLNDDADLSHKIGSSDYGYITVTKGTHLAPAVGTYITRYGDNTGYSSGTVEATNITVTTDQWVTVRGLTRAQITSGRGSELGDSGGPYVLAGAFCGVHHGQMVNNSNLVLFTPYALLNEAGFTAIGSHSCMSWNDAGASYHSGFCSICKETVYELHSDNWNHLLARCMICGRTGQHQYD